MPGGTPTWRSSTLAPSSAGSSRRARPGQREAPTLIGRRGPAESLLSGSRDVDATHAADLVDPHQVVEQPLGNRLGVETILEHAIGVRNGEHRQAVRLILVADRGLQGIWHVVIAIPGNQNEL